MNAVSHGKPVLQPAYEVQVLSSLQQLKSDLGPRKLACVGEQLAAEMQHIAAPVCMRALWLASAGGPCCHPENPTKTMYGAAIDSW